MKSKIQSQSADSCMQSTRRSCRRGASVAEVEERSGPSKWASFCASAESSALLGSGRSRLPPDTGDRKMSKSCQLDLFKTNCFSWRIATASRASATSASRTPTSLGTAAISPDNARGREASACATHRCRTTLLRSLARWPFHLPLHMEISTWRRSFSTCAKISQKRPIWNFRAWSSALHEVTLDPAASLSSTASRSNDTGSAGGMSATTKAGDATCRFATSTKTI
mmetsp:Transcript_99020/g.279761  ORF Transcript_99020/g.279761 Transcript_99020/m.279761 type:complete len:225 (-) Transcript_99020:1518-2192(-)